MSYIICDESERHCYCEHEIGDFKARDYFAPMTRGYYGLNVSGAKSFDTLDGVLFGARWNAQDIEKRFHCKVKIFEYNPCTNRIGKEVI